METKKKMMHIGLSMGDIGEYVFLPGSPERSEKISKHFDNSVEMGYNREYRSFTGTLNGTRVSVCSTGMGCPSTAIAVEELYELGARTMIRVGSCASTSLKVSAGDVVIPNGSVRMEGVAVHYAPVEFPAVPDMELVAYLEEAAKKLGIPYNIGVSICKASFFTQTAPESMPVGYDLIKRWESYEKGGATSTEMESAALFIIGEWLRIRTATVLVSATDYKNYAPADGVKQNKLPEIENRAIEVAIAAMREIIKDDKTRS
ncbi:MAG: nucleoside phosphorylase [Oscillospiraceae bacterium]|nr:nucleoside phosphorylase [Oscillospiraceae bacterium]